MKPDSKKPKLLDFIKQRNPPSISAQVRPSQITKQDRVFAEIQHDESLARQRDMTGKEPTTEEAKVPEALVLERAKGRLEALAAARRETGKQPANSNQKTIKRARPSWER